MHVLLSKSRCNAREITKEKFGTILVSVFSRFMWKNCDKTSPSIRRAIGSEVNMLYLLSPAQIL